MGTLSSIRRLDILKMEICICITHVHIEYKILESTQNRSLDARFNRGLDVDNMSRLTKEDTKRIHE